MRTNVLLVENRSEAQRLFTRQFDELSDRFHLIVRSSVEDAKSAIEAEEIHIAVIDLMLDDQKRGNYTGISLIAILRKRLNNVPIVAYSTAFDTEGPEERARLDRRCRDAGATDVRGRNWFTSGEPTAIANYLDGLVGTMHDALTKRAGLTPREDLLTSAMFEEVGVDTIRALIDGAVGFSGDHTVGAMAPGFSGAHVVRVQSTPRSAADASEDNVLKVSRYRYSLERELDRQPRAGAVLGVVGNPFATRDVVAAEGWYGIMSRFAAGKTFAQEVAVCSNRRAVALADVIYRTVIGPSIAQARLVEDPELEVPAIRLSYRAAVRATTSLKRLREVGPVRKQLGKALDRVEEFVVAAANGQWTIEPTEVPTTSLHGDLHAGNIVIDKERCILIDPALSGAYPRLIDVSCLQVDLFLTHYDRTDGRDEDAARIRLWRERLERAGTRWEFSQTNAGAPLAAVGRLSERLIKKHADIPEKEHLSCLLFHLMRGLGRESHSLPKRAIAAVQATVCMEALGL